LADWFDERVVQRERDKLSPPSGFRSRAGSVVIAPHIQYQAAVFNSATADSFVFAATALIFQLAAVVTIDDVGVPGLCRGGVVHGIRGPLRN
jgi:hypothetical protein